ncbi:MAG: DVUA0089 family protein [Bryobacteraceae bacterium]
MGKVKYLVRGAMSVFLLAGGGVAAPFIESHLGDAGRTLATAQPVGGDGVLDTIYGTLDENAPDTGRSVDLFLIGIFDTLGFSAATVDSPGLYVTDPQLFLFDSVGVGVYMNDDDESGTNASQSLLPAGHLLGPLSPGFYYLGIGWFDNEPFSTGGRIFASSNPTGTNGPDLGAGGADPLIDWDENVTQRVDVETLYEIRLTGASFVPEPGTALLVAVPLALTALRRRRRTRTKPSQERVPGM